MTVAVPSAEVSPQGGIVRGIRVRNAILPFVGIALVLGLWEGCPRFGLVSAGSVPPFSQVLAAAGALFADAGFWTNLGASSVRWTIGVALAVTIGIPLGVAMGRNRVLFALVDPILTMSYPVPKAALILLFVLWWGAGDVSRIAIVVLGSLIPIVISAYHGARAIDTRLVWSARALGTRPGVALLAKVVVPAAMPQICAGLRLAIGISIFTLLASELLIRQTGIGSYMFAYLDDGQTAQVWACALILASIAFALDAAFVRGVRASLPWFEGDV